MIALPGRDFTVELMFTIMRSNYKEISDFVQWALDRGGTPTFGPVLGEWHDQQLGPEERRLVLAALDTLDPAEVPNLEGCRAFYAGRNI